MILIAPLFTFHNHRFPITRINFYLWFRKQPQSQFISGQRREISFRPFVKSELFAVYVHLFLLYLFYEIIWVE